MHRFLAHMVFFISREQYAIKAVYINFTYYTLYNFPEISLKFLVFNPVSDRCRITQTPRKRCLKSSTKPDGKGKGYKRVRCTMIESGRRSDGCSTLYRKPQAVYIIQQARTVRRRGSEINVH